MSVGEEIFSEAFEQMLEIARDTMARKLGVDPSVFSGMQHSYDGTGIYRGDIPESPFDKKDYGTPRHSGRYPWGSGDNPYQRNATFLGKISELKKAKGPDGKRLFTEKQIAESMNMNTSELRKRVSLALSENRAYLAKEAMRLEQKGMSRSAIARRMGKNESSIRLLLDEEINERMSKNAKNATLLKERVNKLNYIDVGKGSEEWLGLKPTSMANTLKLLEDEGYTLHDIQIEQLGTGNKTNMKVLAKPGVDVREVYKNRDKIVPVMDVYSDDGGDTIREVKSYVSVDPKRIQIAYPSMGGDKKDGVIELRRGVDDISLGKNHYAQVRILVDNDHYMKGMAVYADDLPPGIDIRFNTSKPDGTPMFKRDGAKESVLKEAKVGLENPFGSNLKPDEKLTKAQRFYEDENGVKHQSVINIVKEEGDVNNWDRNLASQFLSKQTPGLAKQQLKMAYDISKSDLDEIASYTNPVVKAAMLEDFAGRCESDAVNLSAAALPRQNNKIILPLTKIRENEVYAPGYENGEEVVLVRYPHGSISEIPRLTVNNNNKEGRERIGDPATVVDAIGIHPKAASRLSGADFDGDTVLIIPTKGITIKNKEQFPELKGFADVMHEEYKMYPGMHVMTKQEHGLEMGKISNLITDMTLQGANDREIARALKHSMVIVDAEKHKLNYKQSEIDNQIDELKQKYQMKPNGRYGGASTLLSRSTSEEHIPERKLKAPSKMSAEEKERYLNGEQIWENTGKVRVFNDPMLSRMTKEEKAKWKSGDPELQRQVRISMAEEGRLRRREEQRMTDTTKGALYDAFDLVSTGKRETTTAMERVYGDYANAMKDLARQARKLAREQSEWKADPKAREIFADEIRSLDEKLSVARRNSVLERQAQLKAEKQMSLILLDHPELKDDKEHYKREKFRQLEAARKLTGAKKLNIGSKKNPLTDREWKAIESHALSKSKLQAILANADKARLRELALPRTQTGIPTAKLTRAKAMIRSGYSRREICEMLDISEGKLISALDL